MVRAERPKHAEHEHVVLRDCARGLGTRWFQPRQVIAGEVGLAT